jgi:hypothetical protein
MSNKKKIGILFQKGVRNSTFSIFHLSLAVSEINFTKRSQEKFVDTKRVILHSDQMKKDKQ